MATIINQISFQNFYNYYGSFEENSYSFVKGINIVNADNNMGKSKFYNGILWIVNDEVYDSDLKRNCPVSNSYEKMASGRAKLHYSEFEMGVKIVYEHDGTIYHVSKLVSFKKRNDSWIPTPRSVVLKQRDSLTTPVVDVHEIKEAMNNVVPKNIRSYALLQGESMEGLVDLSNHKGLSNTIEILGGIKNVLDINSVCASLIKSAKSLSDKKENEEGENKSKTFSLTEERRAKEQQIERNNAQLEIFTRKKIEAEALKISLENQQLNASKREQFREKLSNLKSQIKELKDQKIKLEADITKHIFKGDSWLLMGLQDAIIDFSNKRDQYLKDLTVINSASSENPNPLPDDSPDAPSLKMMLEKEFCFVCNRPAPKGSPEWEHIKKMLDRPKQEENSLQNNFSEFYSRIQTSAGSFYNSIDAIDDSICDYRDSIEAVEQRIKAKEKEYEDAKQEFSSAGGREGDDGSADRIFISKHTKAERDIDDAQLTITRIKNDSERCLIRIKQIDDELRVNNKNVEVKKYKDFKDMVNTISEIFKETKERIFDSYLSELQVNANEKFAQLTDGNLATGGCRLSFQKQEDGTVQVFIEGANNEITGLGTGFQRMKQLAIVMAIISASVESDDKDNRFDFPFISDAPFSEFGDNFMCNFCNVAPNIFTQTIILIKDLYDARNENLLLNEKGRELYEKMQRREINGSFYVNYVDDFVDPNNFVTKHKKYI